MKASLLDSPFGQIACYESDGDGPAAFLVHGNSASANAFKKQLDGPLGRKYRLITLDLPGHGRSADAESYGIKRYVEVVIDIARQMRASDATFAGWSLGGHVILEAAPELPNAKGFMIFGTPPLGTPPDFAGAFLPHPAMRFTFQPDLTDKEAIEYAAASFRPAFRDIPSSLIDDVKCTDGRARKQLPGSGFRDEMDIVANLRVPLAILHGAQEQLINANYLASLKTPTLWRGKVQMIADAGHIPQWEQPEQFDALLAAFLDETTRNA